MKNIQLTCAHALVKFLIAQKTLIDGKKVPLFPGVFGIFGHGNVACLGQALQENQKDLPTWRGHHEQYYNTNENNSNINTMTGGIYREKKQHALKFLLGELFLSGSFSPLIHR